MLSYSHSQENNTKNKGAIIMKIDFKKTIAIILVIVFCAAADRKSVV